MNGKLAENVVCFSVRLVFVSSTSIEEIYNCLTDANEIHHSVLQRLSRGGDPNLANVSHVFVDEVRVFSLIAFL